MSKDIKTLNHFNPGQHGTKRLQEQYGDRLLCVRYRYDEARGMKLKTVELIIDEKPWRPPFKFRDSDIVPIHLSFEEKELREQIKEGGGRWEPLTKLWLVPYRLVRDTELEAKISESFINSKRREQKKLPI